MMKVEEEFLLRHVSLCGWFGSGAVRLRGGSVHLVFLAKSSPVFV
jgi:hypothetical protein